MEDLIEKNMESFISESKLISFNESEHENIIDLIITIGGDGTILWCLKYFQNRKAPPILSFSGVNFLYMNLIYQIFQFKGHFRIYV